MAIFFESEMGRASLYISTVSPMPNRTHNEYVVTGRTVNGPIVLRAGDRYELDIMFFGVIWCHFVSFLVLFGTFLVFYVIFGTFSYL